MKPIATVLSAAVIGIFASTAAVRADDSAQNSATARNIYPVSWLSPAQPQKEAAIDPLTGKVVAQAAPSEGWRIRPVNIWLSMGTGF